MVAGSIIFMYIYSKPLATNGSAVNLENLEFHEIKLFGNGIHTNSYSSLVISNCSNSTELSVGDQTYKLSNDNYIFSQRCSAITFDDHLLLTPEHLLGSLALLNNFKVRIVLTDFIQEFPVGPEEGKSFFDKLLSYRHNDIILSNMKNDRFHIAEIERDYTVEPADDFSCTVIQSFVNNDTYEVSFSSNDLKDTSFLSEISAARTWIYSHKLNDLLQNSLCNGFRSKWCKIVEEHELKSEAIKRELTLHKLLDLIGDLYVLGCFPKIKLIAKNPNHRLNNKVRNLLLS